MESIDIVVAENCQLMRTGLKYLLHQLSSPVVVREISKPEKLISYAQKDGRSLLFISDCFLTTCPENVVRTLAGNSRYAAIVLISSRGIPLDTDLNFDAEITPSDNEKTICQKMEAVVQQTSKIKHVIRSNEGISEREKEVLTLVARGLTNKEIAEKLFISSHTVITHRKNITAKLGIKTIAGLTVYAVINNLIPAEEIK
ncbi:MAG: response regulator transcription factor [Bacteroidales bacterium]|nr:response regulator transcription factor [Bacteroidales bacterium]